jgi:hypothetical protein
VLREEKENKKAMKKRELLSSLVIRSKKNRRVLIYGQSRARYQRDPQR